MLSFVIALFNEEESLEHLYAELDHSAKKTGEEYEVIFVDDGSTDRSLEILKELAKKDDRIRIFSFRKNQGKAEALTLGFQKAKGDFIITLDADLQDKPSELHKLIKKQKEGWDMICAWRKDRRDPVKKVISSKFFNFLAKIFWGLELHDYNCGLKLYTQEAAKSINLYGGLHRFIPLLVYQQGFTVTEIPVIHEKRKYGKSKFGFSKLWKDLPDIFTMLFLARYSKRPLHFFGTVGSVIFIIGLIFAIYLSILRFQGHAIGRRPLLFASILLMLAGLQIFFTGFLAELILNISNNNKIHFPMKYSTDEDKKV